MCACIYIYVCMCIYIYTYIYIYVCMYAFSFVVEVLPLPQTALAKPPAENRRLDLPNKHPTTQGAQYGLIKESGLN